MSSLVVHGHLLGVVPFDAAVELQRRLMHEAAADREPRATILLCEHPPLVTIGRHGSRLQLRADDETLTRRGLEVRWVARGGGAVVHGPGQLAAYAVVPLAKFGLSVGGLLDIWQAALEATADDVGFPHLKRPGRPGLWSRQGQAAFVGLAVRNDTAYFGAYLNVAPEERLIHLASGDAYAEPGEADAAGATLPTHAEPTTLVASQRRPVRMPTVRHSLLARLSTALGCERYHMFTGHPALPHCITAPS